MFIETTERKTGEAAPVIAQSSPLEQKLEQLAIIQQKKDMLESKLLTRVVPSEATRIIKDYQRTCEMLTLLQGGVTALRAERTNELINKFEKPAEQPDDHEGPETVMLEVQHH